MAPKNVKIYFVRGGYVYPNLKYLDYAGRYGLYWSSTPYSDANRAYGLNFDNSSVNPSSTYNRYYGLSLRCLAR